ncbi:DUF2188 domain-containing protein [Saccharopolyspora sp. NPDC047091]|uniref:DUF2188 domain-containing protein n=1 Tax=Saccharopolyspora sp. NPDC047091 TaxID=3155924 RepID=UPI0033C529B5
MSVLHVVPAERTGDGWKVVGAEAAEHRVSCQADAVEDACLELRGEGGEVVIHDLRGRVRDKRTVRPA